MLWGTYLVSKLRPPSLTAQPAPFNTLLLVPFSPLELSAYPVSLQNKVETLVSRVHRSVYDERSTTYVHHGAGVKLRTLAGKNTTSPQ
jgi:hypothetical protein